MPGDEDGYGETKGFDRASIAFHSRKPYVPDVSAQDLRLPDEATKLRTLRECVVCGVGMAVLYVAFPAFLIGLFSGFGVWYPLAIIGSAGALTALLFALSVWETRRLRELARNL